MALSAAVSMEDRISRAIRESIAGAVDDAVTQAIKDAQREVASKISKITAEVSLNVMKHFSLERMGDSLVIRVQVEGLPK